MPVTIYDVAKRAKVGIGTVSRVINNSPQISPKTRAKVLKVINELKYQPHAMAQSLARRKTHTIACIVPDFTGYFFMEMLQGIQLEITSHGYDLILYSVDEPEKQEAFLKRTLREKKVDGVLLLSLPISDRSADRFAQVNFPIVLVDSEKPSLDSIHIENTRGGFIATEHLIQLGHSHICMITGDKDSTPASARLKGYQQALQQYNIPYDSHMVVQVCDGTEPELCINHGFNSKAGYWAFQQLLQSCSKQPSALFAASDIQAMGAMQAAQEKGIRVPDDLAIVGYDDIELAEWLDLTTMRQPMFEMGKLAVNRLIEKMAKTDLPPYSRSFVPELIIRKSSGAGYKLAS